MTSVTAQRPEHVPDSLVYDYDFFSAPSRTDKPHWDLTNELLTKAPPVFWTPRNGGHWVVTRAEDTIRMFRNYEMFSSNPEFNAAKRGNPTRQFPLFYDPPEHGDARRVFAPFFTPSAVEALTPFIRQVAVDLIEDVKPRGRCEFVTDIAQVFPITIFFRLIDGPMEHRLSLLQMTNDYLRSTDEQTRLNGIGGIAKFMREMIAERRAAPGDDLISRIVTAQFMGRPLTEHEAVSAGTTILMAGLDTVAALMSFAMAFLARSPAHLGEIVADPTIIPSAVEELMRVSGVIMPERGCTRDEVVDGISFKKFDRIVFLLQIQGMTDSAIASPFDVDFRREVSQHLVFGAGAHRCLGSHLARVEMRIFLEEWVKRIPQFEVVAGEKIRVHGGTVWIPERLPLTWSEPKRADA